MTKEEFLRYVDDNLGKEYSGHWAQENWTVVGVYQKKHLLVVKSSMVEKGGHGTYTEGIMVPCVKNAFILSNISYQTMEASGARYVQDGPYAERVPYGPPLPPGYIPKTPDTGVHPGVSLISRTLKEELSYE